MPSPSALACVRCGTQYALDQYASDCAACRTADTPANLTLLFATAPGQGLDRDRLDAKPASLWRWAAFLPAEAKDAVSLGEGNTPLRPAPALGLGEVWIKDETRNPTWSFKDRLASVAVTMARRFGAKMIVSSSSGNAGAAAAAYAAKAGMPCIVFTFKAAAGALVTQMRAYGAMVVVAETPADRWRLQREGVRAFGWYPASPFFAPVVGSNPYGIEGYKTIAYEIAEAFAWQTPDWCVLPVCFGDALYGTWKGFEELRALGWIARTPRFAAAEVSGSLATAMVTGEALPPARRPNVPSIATSIAWIQGTVQALEVLRRTDGVAVAIDDDTLVRWIARLAGSEGLWAEPASVAPLAAIERLRQQGIAASGERIVALITASGLKDTSPVEANLPPPPTVTGGLDHLLASLRQTYGFYHHD